MLFFQKDVFVVSCDLVTDIALHHLADIHRSHDSTLSAFLAPVPQTSADREAANNPKAKKKTDSTGKIIDSYYQQPLYSICSVVCNRLPISISLVMKTPMFEPRHFFIMNIPNIFEVC